MKTRKTPVHGRSAAPRAELIDAREQLYNGREVGPIAAVQLPTEAITRLHGIFFDIDTRLFRPDAPIAELRAGPKKLFKRAIGPMLARHATLSGAEVRHTGRGLHAIVWLAQPIDFESSGERERWSGIVQAVQAALPIDPDQPGITAVTRPVGSVNSKNGKAVEVLKPGTPVPVAEVVRLYEQLASAPFRTVAGILFGSDRISPCPVCRADGSSLSALDRVGRCYGSCGRVALESLYEAFLSPRTPPGEEGGHGGR